MRFSAGVLFLTMLAACSTGGAGSAVPASVAVRLASPLFFGSSSVSPANFDVMVTNQSTVPLTLRRINLSTVGGVQYTIQPLERDFAENLAPGESKTVRIATDAVASSAGSNPTERMNVRVVAEFEMPDGHRFRKIANVVNVAP